MTRSRIIPVLLLQNKGLVKTVRFKNPVYIGDPINAVKIFNDKEVDELILLDISTRKKKNRIDFDYLKDIVSEAFMPIGYGGGIRNMDDIHRLFQIGIEKVIINSLLYENKHLIKEMVAYYGSQSIVACVDYRKHLFGGINPYFFGGVTSLKKDLTVYVKELEELGFGEIILQCIDHEGTYKGYDIEVLSKITNVLNIPVVVSGGAGHVSDLRLAIENGASAAAAGSIFVFNGKHKAVLISYVNN